MTSYIFYSVRVDNCESIGDYTYISEEGSDYQIKYKKPFSILYNFPGFVTYNLTNGISMLSRILAGLTLFLFIGHTARSQDPEFSQFYANPLYLNPALTGAEVFARTVVNYRNQWPGISGNYVTYNASYDQYFPKLHGGLGVLINVDNAGDGILTTTQASLMYSYSLRIGWDLYINMALQGTFCQKTLNWGLLRFADQFDPQRGFVLPTVDRPPDYNSVMFADFDAGAIFGWKGVLHGGIAVHHLTTPNMAYYNTDNNELPMKFTAHFGVNINPNGEGMLFDPIFWIAPNILYQQQGKFHQLNTGLYVIRLPLILGTWYRLNFENGDALITLIGIVYKNVKLGYSYDITMSKLKNNTGGAHEISITWLFGTKEHLREIFRLNAPGF